MSSSLSLSLSRKGIKPYALCFLSILLIHWGIASYQAAVDTVLILLFSAIIAAIIDNQGNVKSALYKSRFIIASTVLAIISYKIIFDICKHIGLITRTTDNIKMLGIEEMLGGRIFSVIKLAFENVFTYDVVFMPVFMSVLYAVFLCVFLILLFLARFGLRAKFCIVLALILAIIASQTHNVLSSAFSYNAVRIDILGLGILRFCFVALVFKAMSNAQENRATLARYNIAKNLLFMFCACLIWVCVLQDLYAQKLQKLAFETESKMLNRIIDRIEQDKNFSYEKTYCGVFFGTTPNPYDTYYKNSKNAPKGLNASLISHWTLAPVFAVTMGKGIFKDCNFYNVPYHLDKDPKVLWLLDRLKKAGILATLRPFPHKDSVVIFEDIIVFVGQNGGLEALEKLKP